jgi:hypothetical protein
MVESAFDYHDIGLWTAGDLAYLELSEDLALDANREKGFGLDPGTLRIGDPLAPQGDGVRRTERRPRQRRAEGPDASHGDMRHGLGRAQVRQVPRCCTCGITRDRNEAPKTRANLDPREPGAPQPDATATSEGSGYSPGNPALSPFREPAKAPSVLPKRWAMPRATDRLSRSKHCPEFAAELRSSTRAAIPLAAPVLP